MEIVELTRWKTKKYRRLKCLNNFNNNNNNNSERNTQVIKKKRKKII